MILEVIKKQTFTLSPSSILFVYILRIKAWIFLNEISVVDFVELAIFHSS